MTKAGRHDDQAVPATQRLDRPTISAAAAAASDDGSVFAHDAPTALPGASIVVLEGEAAGLVHALERGGFLVRPANSGVQAIELIEQAGPDAVVVGPGEAERRRILVGALRQRFPAVALILLVGDGDSIDSVTGANVDAVLPWPLPPADGVKRAFEFVLGAQSRRGATAEASRGSAAPVTPLASELDAALNDDSAAATGPIRRSSRRSSTGLRASVDSDDDIPVVTATLVPEVARAEVEHLPSAEVAPPTQKLRGRRSRKTAATSDLALSTRGAARLVLPRTDDGEARTSPSLPSAEFFRPARGGSSSPGAEPPGAPPRALRDCVQQLEECVRVLDDSARAGDRDSAAHLAVVREALRLLLPLVADETLRPGRR